MPCAAGRISGVRSVRPPGHLLLIRTPGGPQEPGCPVTHQPWCLRPPRRLQRPACPWPPWSPRRPSPSAPAGEVSRGEPVLGKLVCALRTRVSFAKLTNFKSRGWGIRGTFLMRPDSRRVSGSRRFGVSSAPAGLFVPFLGPTNTRLQVRTRALPFPGPLLRAVKAYTRRPARPQWAEWAGVERAPSRACPGFLTCFRCSP